MKRIAVAAAGALLALTGCAETETPEGDPAAPVQTPPGDTVMPPGDDGMGTETGDEGMGTESPSP